METRTNLRKLTLLAGAAVLSTGAMAMPLEETIITETEIVKYSIPESATPPGAKVLYRKLQAAASRVCSERMPGSKIRQLDSACFTDALTKAVSDVGNPLLLTLHQQKHPGARMASSRKEQPAETGTLASR